MALRPDLPLKFFVAVLCVQLRATSEQETSLEITLDLDLVPDPSSIVILDLTSVSLPGVGRDMMNLAR